MGKNIKKYDAFISYRHDGLDSFVAENLHKELEAFKLPRCFAKTKNQGEKTKINRVFRDKEELPIASNLSDIIIDALENSEFLIVICTPRLIESKWCQREIETFIKLHGREHVLAVLAEGEPGEVFPELLQKEEVTEVNSDGTKYSYYREVEPLAADVRGKSKKEILKKIKQEVLRLAAPMFECSYDDIRQRHREQRLKRRLCISIGISSAMLVFGSVSLTQAIKIKKQSEVIEEQYNVIENQYNQSLQTQSEILASVAIDKLLEGDRKSGIENALAALPDNLDNPDRPLVPEAIYALTSALRLYDNGKVLEPDYYLEHTSDIIYVKPIGNGYLFTIDESDNIWIWDLEAGKVVTKYEGVYARSDYDNALCIEGIEKFYIMEENSIDAYSIVEEKKLWSQNIDHLMYIFNNPLKKELFVASKETFYIINTETGNIKKEINIPIEYNDMDISYIQKSIDGAIYYVGMNKEEMGAVIVSVDVNDIKTELFATVEDDIDIIKMSNDGTKLFCMMNKYEDEISINVKVDGIIACYSLIDNSKIWEYRTDTTIDGISLVSDNELLVKMNRELTKLSMDSGYEIKNVDVGKDILGVYVVGEGKYQILLSDGSILFETNNFSFAKMSGNYDVIGNELEDFIRVDDNYLTLEQNSKQILVYNFELSIGAVECELTEEQVGQKYGLLDTNGGLDILTAISSAKEQTAIVDVKKNAIAFMSLDKTKE